jgi:DNA-3-methyladenine glycosylase II
MIHNGRSPKLPFDPAEAVAHLRAADAKLAALIERAGPFTLKLDPSSSPFESLLESILYQQLNGKAAATIHARVREFYQGNPTPQLLLDTPDERLRAAGVSGNKSRALKDLAARTLDGTVPAHAAIKKMSDAEIVERLTQVRGIGSWTVEMLLIFRIGRPQGLRSHLSAPAQDSPSLRRRSAQARGAAQARQALGSLSFRGELVSLARLRSG